MRHRDSLTADAGLPLTSKPATAGAPAPAPAHGAGEAVRAAPAGWAALCGCLSVEYYRPLFNVTTAEVGERAKAALLPFTAEPFFAVIGDAPDLYVPLWGSVTLVFLIGAMANFSSWASFDAGDMESIWHYDFALVTSAAGFIFGYLLVCAAATWAALRYMGVPFSFMKLLCLFGYAVLPFLPASLLCGFPLSWLQWLAVVGAATLSAYFLVRAAVPTFRTLLAARYEEGTAGRLMTYTSLGLCLLQAGFGATMKFVFFSHIGSA